MRRELVLASFLLAVAVLSVPAVGSSCSCSITGGVEDRREEIELNVLGWIPVLGDVLSLNLTFGSAWLRITDTYTCKPFPPCCPVFWHTDVYTRQLIEYGWEPYETATVSAHLVPDVSVKWGPQLDASGTRCEAWHTIEGSEHTASFTVEAAVPFLRLSGGRQELQYARICICGDDPQEYAHCELTSIPSVSANPGIMWVPFDGQEPGILTVLVSRKRGRLEDVLVSLSGVPLGVSVEGVKRTVVAPPPGIEAYPALLVEFALSTDLPLSNAPLTVFAEDECGRRDEVRVILRAGNRPTIKRDEGGPCGWGGPHDICFIIDVEDPDLNERFEVKWSAEGGEVLSPLGEIWCMNADGPCHTGFAIRLRPEPGVTTRNFTLWVVDQYGLESNRVTWNNPTGKIPNIAPAISISPSQLRGKPGQVVQATVSATDPDGDTITITQISGPGAFATVEGEGTVSNSWTWTVPEPYWGSSWRLVGFRADDGWGGSDLAYLLIHVIQPPRAYDGHVTVPRGGTATASLYVSDPDTPSDGLKVTFTPPPGIETNVVAIEEPPDYYGSYYGYTARVEVSVDQTLRPGSHQVDFTVTDPDGGSDSATLYVHVYVDPELNSSPEFALDELSGELGIHVPGGTGPTALLMGPVAVSDPNGDPITVALESVPHYGLPDLSLSGSQVWVTYQLALGGAYDELVGACQGGDDLVDEFIVVASDGYGGEDVLVVAVTITPEDKAPVAHSQTVDYHGGTVPIILTGKDPDGDPIRFDLFSNPNHGTLSGTPPNLTYTSTDPAFLKRGNEDSFTFTVTDTVLTSNPAAVTIVVVNQPPVAVNDSAETTEGVSVTISVLINDYDPDGDPFTLVSVGPAGHGIAEIAGDQVEYAPNAGFCGEDSFSYTIADAYGAEATAAVTVVVKDVTPPTITVPPDMDLGCNPVDTSPEATGQATATDNCDPNPVITYTDEVSEKGCRVTITRTWKATDACGNGAQEVQTITYISDTVPPTIHCPGSFTRYVHEPAGTLVWVSFPVTVTDNCDPNPSLSCAPGGGWFEVGTTTQAYTSCTAADACDHTASQDCTFWVTVELVNHDPVAGMTTPSAPNLDTSTSPSSPMTPIRMGTT